ncbi:MAG: ATP-binding protein [Bryobacteraceae bacterium]
MVTSDVDSAYIQSEISSIRLKGFDDIHLLLLAGDAAYSVDLSAWKRSLSGAGRLVLVLALSDFRFLQADAAFPSRQGFLVLEPDAVAHVLTSHSPQDQLKVFARKRLSPFRLNPFQITTVPPANMFFGRQHELAMLSDSYDSSFALAGPGRIGKSSILRHFQAALRRDDPLRYGRTFYIDFYTCEDTSESGICQFLATRINDTKRAREMTSRAQLEGFLRFERRQRQGPLELLLDEVDRVCGDLVFETLGELVKGGGAGSSQESQICRVILGGKATLFEFLNEATKVWCQRIRRVPLSPLGARDSSDLLLQPLRDLGFRVPEEQKLEDLVFEDTNGFPHLIQFYGSCLVDRAIKAGSDVIDQATFDDVRNDFETAQMFANPVLSIGDETSEWIALALIHSPQHSFTEMDIHHIAAKEGLRMDEKQVAKVCRRLYISNVLLWNGDRYSIATRALSRYARKLGYLHGRLLELRKPRKTGSQGH